MIGKTSRCCVVCYNSRGGSVVCDLHMRWGEKKFMVVREKANGQFGNYEVQ
jgi:hypothetical protein